MEKFTWIPYTAYQMLPVIRTFTYKPDHQKGGPSGGSFYGFYSLSAEALMKIFISSLQCHVLSSRDISATVSKESFIYTS